MATIELVIDDLPEQKRQLVATEQEILALAKDIKQHGLQHPIAVYDGVVVDGLKRIAALVHLRHRTVPALTSDDFVELCDHIKLSRPEGTPPATISRTLDMIADLWPTRELFTRRQKIAAGKQRHMGRFTQTKASERRTPRSILGGALGWGDNRTEIITLAYRTSLTDPVAREKLEEVRAGLMSIYGWQAWNTNRSVVLVPTAPAEEVRTVMERGLRAINNALDAMGKFGSVDVLTISERETITKELNQQRVKILQLSKSIRAGILDEVEEVSE